MRRRSDSALRALVGAIVLAGGALACAGVALAADDVAPITVDATLSPKVAADPNAADAGVIRLGEVTVLTIVAEGPGDATLYAPFRPATGPFKLVGQAPGARKVADGRITETYRFELLPTRMGYEKIPPIEVPYELADGTRGSVSTKRITVDVQGHLVNDADPAIGDAPGPVEVIGTNWLLIWTLSTLGALVLAALLTLFVLRALEARFRAMEPGPPPRPANEVALERLAALEAAPPEEMTSGERLAKTIDVLRDYLGGRYGFDALEMTTSELLAELLDADLKDVDPGLIRSLLEDADLVKFAQLPRSDAEARAKAPIVRSVVERTWEAPEEHEEEIIPVLESASRKQRVYAACIDIALGGAGALVLFGALWATNELRLGWTALVMLGVWLWIRDWIGGVSPGKRILGLSVVQRRDRQPLPTSGQLLNRNLLLLIWPLGGPLEALVLRRHPLQLRLGDLWAETEVVRGGRR